MTYQEIKDRLSKCELTLEKFKNGAIKPAEKETVNKLHILKESLLKQLSEMDKGVVYTDDEDAAKDLADDGANVKLTKEMKPGSPEAGEHERFKRLSSKDQGTIRKIQAMMAKEKSTKEASVEEVDGPPIGKMTRADMIDFLMAKPEDVKDMSDEELRDRVQDKNADLRENLNTSEAVDPSITDLLVQFVTLMGMGYGAYAAAKKLSNKHGDIDLDSIKAALSKKEGADETDDYGRPHVDPKGSRTYLSDKDIEDMKPSNRIAKMAKEDTDVGHQDDEPSMLKSSAMETATYAAKLYKKLNKYDQQDGEVDFPNWWQKKLILARDYMSAAFHYLDSEEKQPVIDQLALESVNEVDEDRFVKAAFEDLEQVISNLAHTANISEDEALEMAIEKLETMLHGAEDLDENAISKIQRALDQVTKHIKTHLEMYKDAESPKNKQLAVNMLKKLNVQKKQLEKHLEDTVAGTGSDQTLDSNSMDENADYKYLTQVILDAKPKKNVYYSSSRNVVNIGGVGYDKGDLVKNFNQPQGSSTKIKNNFFHANENPEDTKQEVERLSNGKIKVEIQKGYGDKPMVVYSIKEGDGMSTKIKPSEGDPTNMAYTDKVKEGRGDGDMIFQIINDRAAEDGISEREAAAEVIAAISEEYMVNLKQIREDMTNDNPVPDVPVKDLQWIHDQIVNRMKEVAKIYREKGSSGTITLGVNDYDRKEHNVVDLLKKLTIKKREVEAALDRKVANVGYGQELEINEGTDLYDRNGIQITRYSGGEKGLMLQVSYGGKYVQIPFTEYFDFIRAMASIKDDIRDMLIQGPLKEKEIEEAGPGFKHDCAAKVVHEKYGKGNTIPEKHTLVKEGSKYVVTHYDVLFENGNTVLDIPVNELKIETTNEHWHKGYKKKKK